MGTDKEKNEQRIELNRQHLAEWNAQLSLEVRARIALDVNHKEEHKQAYLDEINFRDRAVLATKHLQMIQELVQQNRVIRISMRKRHTQENEDLNQKLA